MILDMIRTANCGRINTFMGALILITEYSMVTLSYRGGTLRIRRHEIDTDGIFIHVSVHLDGHVVVKRTKHNWNIHGLYCGLIRNDGKHVRMRRSKIYDT